jgi:hypothetical protein
MFVYDMGVFHRRRRPSGRDRNQLDLEADSIFKFRIRSDAQSHWLSPEGSRWPGFSPHGVSIEIVQIMPKWVVVKAVSVASETEASKVSI